MGTLVFLQSRQEEKMTPEQMADFRKSVLKAIHKQQPKLRELVQDLLKLSPTDGGALRSSFSTLMALFSMRESNIDMEDGPALRAQLFEHFGSSLINMLHVAANEPKESCDEEIMGAIEAIHKTLYSPIDDADKIEHMKELLNETRMEKLRERQA